MIVSCAYQLLRHATESKKDERWKLQQTSEIPAEKEIGPLNEVPELPPYLLAEIISDHPIYVLVQAVISN
jgi:hypothetical protein